MVKFATNANGQVTPPGGQVWNKCIRTNYETLPEAQRIQDIESGTGIISLTEIHLTLFDLILEIFNKNLGFGQTPPPLVGQNAQLFPKTDFDGPL